MDEAFFMENNLGINRFVQLTYMTLCSTGPVPLQRLESAYRGIQCIIHPHVGENQVDVGALSYVCARLPECVFQIDRVLFGQSETFLRESGVALESCTEVYAKARRRRYLFDNKQTLIAFIASKSDLDDVIPSLLALQIEWNKCHRYLRSITLPARLEDIERETIAIAFHIDLLELEKLERLFGERFLTVLKTMQARACDLHVQNYEASYCRYRKETEAWWKHIKTFCPDIETRPVYFISSNTHSLINLISGFAEDNAEEILQYARTQLDLADYARLYTTLEGERKQNLLYFLLMKYEQAGPGVSDVSPRRIAWEQQMGISRICSSKTLDVPTQVIDLCKLAQRSQNPRFRHLLADSPAMVLNIDYPLGRTAYFILNKIAEHVTKILGVYVIGKAASLFADRGDVLIPSFIADQHTRNQYYFENAIQANDIVPFLDTNVHGIYDNQRAVTVLGTMLQNKQMLNDLLLSGFTDLEMEAGPYLAAIYELTRPKRYPERETITISSKDMAVGIVHYVSDNPLSEQRLDTNLELNGVDATYACTRAVLEKVLVKERENHA
jgi:hypothetical protein